MGTFMRDREINSKDFEISGMDESDCVGFYKFTNIQSQSRTGQRGKGSERYLRGSLI